MENGLHLPLFQGRAASQFLILVVSVMAVGAVSWKLAHILSAPGPCGLAVAGGALTFAAFGGAALSTAFVLGGCAIAGAAIWKRTTTAEYLSPWLAAALGIALLSIFTTLVARWPINNVWMQAAVATAPYFLLLAKSVRAIAFEWLARLRQGDRAEEGLFHALGIAALFVVLSIHIFFAAMPEFYWDAMVWHLYVSSYMKFNQMWPVEPIWTFSHMPLGVDFLYAFFFGLGGEESARLYNIAAFALIGGILYDVVAERGSKAISIWIAVVFSSIPLSFIETASLFVEVSIALWVMAATVILARLWKNLRTEHLIVVLTPMVAASLGKLHGALAAVIVGLAFLIGWSLRGPNVSDAVRLSMITIMAALTALFPYILSWIYMGNPVFPFYNEIFNSEFWPPVPFVDTRWTGRFDLSLLWDATFESGKYLEGDNGSIGLALAVLLLPSVLIVTIRRSAQDYVFLVVGLTYMFAIAIQIQYLRYFYPVLPILLAIIGFAIASACVTVTSRRVLIGGLASLSLLNLWLLPSAGWILKDFDARVLVDPGARYEREAALVPERTANTIVNELANSEDARVYYTNRPYAALLQGKAYSADWYSPIVHRDKTQPIAEEEVRMLLRELGITHIIDDTNDLSMLSQAVRAVAASNGKIVTKINFITVYSLQL